LRPDGSNSDNMMIFAPPAETKLVKPTIIEGRWLRPDDENAIVISTLMLRNEPDVKVGSDITLKIEGRETQWRVVGISTGGMMMSIMFANYPYFVQVTRDVGQAQWVFVVTREHSVEHQNQAARALESHFERIGLEVGMIAGVAEERQQAVDMFEVIVVLLLIMAVLLAVIGGLGLMGTMSINVIERTREIGVMRAIGASNEAVRWVFIVEGVLIGVLSWLAAIAVAYPISYGLSSAVGYQFLNTPLNHTFSLEGIVIWLVVVVILAAIASFLPAWNASRLTVREVLAYE
jgi:putative ABC transport system permease protein